MTALSGRLSKIDLAKEAAMSVVDMLTDRDQIGVIAFDAEADEIVKLGKIQSRKHITDSIARMKARGGTNMYPALKIAYDRLKSADTQLKHVILLSDGRSLQMNESYNLVKRMVQDSITVSTVVISDEADKKAMQDMANIGSGRYYETNDAGNLPKLFIKETFMASKLIMEGNFHPIVSSNSEILKGIDYLPSLRGYIATSAKDGSSVILKSENGDPILSSWQYGLGRSLAFTSDTQPKWAVEWLQWNDFSKFWSQAVGWCLPVPSKEFEVSASIIGGKGSLTVDAVSSSGQLRNFLEFQANAVRPDMTSEAIKLNQSGSGRYEAEFDAEEMGTYLINVTEMNNGKPVSSQNTGVAVSYSPEYSDLESNAGLLKNLAEVTEGKFNPDVKGVAERKPAGVWHIQDVWKWLLISSIPLFFLDVALRRITISKEQIRELKTRLHKPNLSKPVENATLTNLKAHKSKMFEIHTIQSLNVQPEIKNTNVRSEPVKAYTSRLLEAKRRVGTH
jgi:Ca-activated chloride channel family protein